MPKKSQDNETIREERKEQIRQEALRQFAAKGLFATKIKDIASSLGIAQGLIYHYYRSKEDIYVELIRSAMDTLNEGMVMLRTMDVQPHVKIRLAAEQMYHTIATSEDFIQTCRFIAQASNSTAIPEEAKQILEQKRWLPYQDMADIMAEGQKQGTIVEADPMELSILFWTSINGLAIYKATRQQTSLLPTSALFVRLFVKDGVEPS